MAEETNNQQQPQATPQQAQPQGLPPLTADTAQTAEQVMLEEIRPYLLDPRKDYPEPYCLLEYQGIGMSAFGGVQAVAGQKKNGKSFLMTQLMAAVLAATLANHGLAVLLGVLLGGLLPETEMRIAGSIAFIIFGLMTIREKEDDGGEELRQSRSPFWTVALTFFLGEMGDKTQLAVLTIAAAQGAWLPVLAGSTTAMLIADGLGALLGAKLRNHVSPAAMKKISACVFILCGIAGLASIFS